MAHQCAAAAKNGYAARFIYADGHAQPLNEANSLGRAPKEASYTVLLPQPGCIQATHLLQRVQGLCIRMAPGCHYTASCGKEFHRASVRPFLAARSNLVPRPPTELLLLQGILGIAVAQLREALGLAQPYRRTSRTTTRRPARRRLRQHILRGRRRCALPLLSPLPIPAGKGHS